MSNTIHFEMQFYVQFCTHMIFTLELRFGLLIKRCASRDCLSDAGKLHKGFSLPGLDCQALGPSVLVAGVT